MPFNRPDPRQPHNQQDKPPAAPPPPTKLPYPSLESAILAQDYDTADIYWANGQYDLAWLDRQIAIRKQQAGSYDPNKPADAFNNNPAVAAYAASLVTAYVAYRTHVD